MRELSKDILDYIIEKSRDKNAAMKAEKASESLKYILISKDPSIFVFLG